MYYEKVKKNTKIAVYDLNPQGKHVVFFIHGWPLSHKIFEYQFNIFPKHNIRCISIDLRGFGKSDAPWSGYSYDSLAEDIYEIIKGLNVKSLILAGFSMGGAIAIRYMSKFKGYKVSKLALLGAAAPSFTRYDGYPYGMRKEEVNDLIIKTYEDRPNMIKDFGENLFASNPTLEFKNWFSSIALEASGHGTIKTAKSLRDENLYDDLKSIKVPTGIFHGMLDKVCPFEFAIELNKNIKCATLYSFEESGHVLFYDELERFNNKFIEFVCK